MPRRTLQAPTKSSLSRFLFFHLNGLRCFTLSPLDPLCKRVRIHERMRRARLARFEHESAFQHTTAGIAVVAGPAMDLQIHLHTFNLRDLVGAPHGFFGVGESTAITGSALDNRLIGSASVIDGDSLGRQ